VQISTYNKFFQGISTQLLLGILRMLRLVYWRIYCGIHELRSDKSLLDTRSYFQCSRNHLDWKTFMGRCKVFEVNPGGKGPCGHFGVLAPPSSCPWSCSCYLLFLCHILLSCTSIISLSSSFTSWLSRLVLTLLWEKRRGKEYSHTWEKMSQNNVKGSTRGKRT